MYKKNTEKIEIFKKIYKLKKIKKKYKNSKTCVKIIYSLNH